MFHSRRIFLAIACIASAITAPVALAGSCKTFNPATTPTADFVEHGNGTVTHKPSGLTWKSCPEGISGPKCGEGKAISVDWQGALSALASMNAVGFAGFSDWRLPNIKELQSIVEISCSAPSINEAIFPSTPADWFWSSTSLAVAPTDAWGINFGSGYSFPKTKQAPYGHVRLVRGGSAGGDFDMASGTKPGK